MRQRPNSMCMIWFSPNMRIVNSGERVIYRGEPGLLLRCFTDGIGHVRLDNGRVVAALVQDLHTNLPRERKAG